MQEGYGDKMHLSNWQRYCQRITTINLQVSLSQKYIQKNQIKI